MNKHIADIQFITPDIADLTQLKTIVETVCQHGCRWVQLRLKDCSDTSFLSIAKNLQPIVKKYDAIFIINDRVEIAKAINADGVHLGKNDWLPQQARRVLGDNVIIGATADDLQTVKKHMDDVAVDYIGLGPFRYTTTKRNISPVLGEEGYKKILAALSSEIVKPIVAVGGVTYKDILQLKQLGLHGVAVSSDMVRNVSCYGFNA